MTNIVQDKVTVNGVTYVREGAVNAPAQSLEGKEFVIIRSDRAGVFFGYRDEDDYDDNIHDGRVVLNNVRRMWRWWGAATLSQAAVDGVNRPSECKFPVAVPRIVILGVIEVIQCTAKAQKSLEGVPVWSA